MERGQIARLAIEAQDPFSLLNGYLAEIVDFPLDDMTTVLVPGLSKSWIERIYREAIPWDTGSAMSLARDKWRKRRVHDDAVLFNVWTRQLQDRKTIAA